MGTYTDTAVDVLIYDNQHFFSVLREIFAQQKNYRNVSVEDGQRSRFLTRSTRMKPR